MTKQQITTVSIIIETGGDVPTQVTTQSIHDVEDVRRRFKNALIDYWSDKPALVELESGDENQTTLFFPVMAIKMLSVQKIPIKKLVEVAHQVPNSPKLM